MSVMAEFLQQLELVLTPNYMPPNCPGGHEILHVRRMMAMDEEILEVLPGFSLEEFRAACLLHNADRVQAYSNGIAELGLEQFLAIFLERSPFDEEARKRIVDAVRQHSKKDDEPGDSPLLTALRVADKLDRLGPLGIIAAVAFRGGNLLSYDEQNPFGYNSTVEGKLKSLYNDFFRVLEWVGMLPSDAARGLINREDLGAYVAFVRALGAQLARMLQVENKVEDDIRKALGKYYEKYALYI